MAGSIDLKLLSTEGPLIVSPAEALNVRNVKITFKDLN